MFGSSNSHGANAYAKVGIETGVISASPHKLIIMLYDGAITSLTNATQFMKDNDIPAKGHSISKAIAIIETGLRASLDKKAGGDIAASLDALYEYMSNRLLQANLNNQPEGLIEVQNLLRDLKFSWEAIAPVTNQMSAEVPPPPIDPLAPRSATLFKA
ncbi:flagellar export chaperone FliS [Undibacterium flavidum]|uniref:Flagellar secretion chaperone FliS n=1 Tax=Undibacterium flavidum TaxID=2762297 RepID=A0ABR6Y6P8_9BURK|nr:flagellar export chaperone FliS [Undibacterium flavidum]MBC3872299.1 flagellar export chaperone FliS [Undibacterium flavidum]